MKKQRLFRVLVALGIAGSSLGLATGVASAAPRQNTGGPLTRGLCEFLGGVYVAEDGYFLCYLPGGTVIVCLDSGECTSVPLTTVKPGRLGPIATTTQVAAQFG
jgi:hypothetical protein